MIPAPVPIIEGDLANTKWVIEFRNNPNPDWGRRQVRVFHYGEVVENPWTYDWVDPEDTTDDNEEFYIRVAPDQLLLDEDADIPREDRGGNVGLWIWITESRENGVVPIVDVYYIGNPNNGDEVPTHHIPRYEYDVLFASEQEIVG